MGVDQYHIFEKIPYCIQRKQGNLYRVQDRNYQTIGLPWLTDPESDNSETCFKIKGLTPKLAVKMSWEGCSDTSLIYFHNGRFHEFKTKKFKREYAGRLDILRSLDIQPVKS